MPPAMPPAMPPVMPPTPPPTPPLPDPCSIIAGLTTSAHLQRERNLAQFATALPTYPPHHLERIKTNIFPYLRPENPWHTLHGALAATTHLAAQPSPDHQFLQLTLPPCAALLSHPEPRVRSAASTLLRLLAANLGRPVWSAVSPRLRRAVRDSLQLDDAQRAREAARVAARDLNHTATRANADGLRMVHETEGWRALESSLLALADLMAGCGPHVLPPAAGEPGAAAVEGLEEVLHFVCRAKDHPNRFVREAGLKLLNSLANAARHLSDAEASVVLSLFTHRCMSVVLEGLQDNWSQVRFAASVAIRTILESLPPEPRRAFYPDLLPRMCLNRHYVAEGVRNLSLDTWRTVIASDGRKYLLRTLDKCIKYYESQCEADNHAVREAACQGLGELCAQLPREAIEPFVPQILTALIACFKDESWPVRDHACRALGGVVGTFPQASEESGHLAEVHALFEKHLADNIPSVRINCAAALAAAVSAFEPEHPTFGSQRALHSAARLMRRLEHEPEQRFSDDARDRDTQFGSASKLARDNDEALHTDQVVYSCGSLAPKLRRGAGCMDHGFTREQHAWEEADGGLRLWAALAERGVEGVWGVVEEVMRTGELGAKKAFAQEMRMRQSWLDSFATAVQKCRREDLDGIVVVRAAGIVETCRGGGNPAVRSAAGNCSRVLRRVVGLGAYAQAEREAKDAEK